MASLILFVSCGAAFSCSHPGPVEPTDPQVQASISDAAHGGQEHFYFLPPLVQAPDYAGVFDPTRAPIVEICALGTSGCEPVIAEYSMAGGPGSETVRVDMAAEHYIVNWHTNEFELEDGQVYRIRVLIEGQEAGHADVLVVASGKDLKNAETEEEIPLKDGRTLPIKFRTEEGLEMENGALAFPPDSLPSQYYSSPDFVEDPVCSKIPFRRHILWIRFRDGTTRAERQSAVDQVAGTVVGGRPHSEQGIYIIRVDDDEHGSGVCSAKSLLRTLPSVEAVGADKLLTPTYRKPTDGAGFREWDMGAVIPDGSQARWGLEAIAAPLAWGCSTGSPALPVSVVDVGFRVEGNADLDSIVNDELSVRLDDPLTTVFHGTAVASVLAAGGNNGKLMTGVMWASDLRLHGVTAPGISRASDLEVSVALGNVLASQSPPRVVNVSWALDWGTAPSDTSTEDVNDAADTRDLFKFEIESAKSFNPLPLIIVAAGNTALMPNGLVCRSLSTIFPVT